MWAGALASPLLGRLIDRRGVRPVVLTGTGVLGLLSLTLAHQTAILTYMAASPRVALFWLVPPNANAL